MITLSVRIVIVDNISHCTIEHFFFNMTEMCATVFSGSFDRLSTYEIPNVLLSSNALKYSTQRHNGSIFDCGVPLLVVAVRANFTVMSSEILVLFNLK